MRKLSLLTILLIVFLSGCKTQTNNTNEMLNQHNDESIMSTLAPTISSMPITEPTPTASPTKVMTTPPTNTPTSLPTNIPTNIPTNMLTSIPTNIPTEAPILTLPPTTGDTGENTIDDLSAFLPLQKCFIDYTFQVERYGREDDRTSYLVYGSYDLNNDGKEDSITILQTGRNRDLTYIEINQTKLTFDVDSPYDGEVHILDLDKSDSYLEVASYDDGPSCDPEYTIFRYDGSSIYELGRIDAYASIDGNGRWISYFHQNNYFRPEFCSAWYEIINNIMVRKNNSISRYLGQMYEFSGGEAYFIPYDELPEYPEIRWDEMKHFDKCKVKLIDIWGLSEEQRTLDYYYIELPTGEKGLIYFWIGD